MSKENKITGDGNCFEVAAGIVALFDSPFAVGDGERDAITVLAAMQLTELDLLLTHAMVRRPSDGLMHPHAWVEIPTEQLVVDFSNGHRSIMQQKMYYELGHVENVTHFTASEAKHNLLEHGTYGPWENDDGE